MHTIEAERGFEGTAITNNRHFATGIGSASISDMVFNFDDIFYHIMKQQQKRQFTIEIRDTCYFRGEIYNLVK